MVKDLTTGEFFRADHLLEEHLQQLMDSSKCPLEKLKEYREVVTMVSVCVCVVTQCVCVCCCDSVCVCVCDSVCVCV